MTRVQEKRIGARHRARLAELEYEQRVGKLLVADDVAAMMRLGEFIAQLGRADVITRRLGAYLVISFSIKPVCGGKAPQIRHSLNVPNNNVLLHGGSY